MQTAGLNKYLNEQMKGLTAKVFRTYNASWTFQQQLKNTPEKGTVAEKIAAYNTANRDVAILCNHQKSVNKNFAESFAKFGDKIRAVKYQRMKARWQLFTLNPKLKKKHKELLDDESDMDDEFLDRHEEELQEKALEQARKKFEKENEKLVAEKEKPQPDKVLTERLKEIKAEFKVLAKERKTKKAEPKKSSRFWC
jgi:DNA topoisomerase-1